MRYLVDIETDEVTNVPENNDKKFYELLAERTDDGRQRYQQTGAHDPLVAGIELGQVAGERSGAEDEGEPVLGSAVAPARPGAAPEGQGSSGS